MGKTIIRLFLVVVIFMAVFVLMTSCEKEAKKQESEVTETQKEDLSMIEEVMRKGVIQVGCGIFTPWVFKDEDGNLVGFEVDVANRLAEDLGVELEMVPTTWSGIIPALLTGKFDLIIGGMTITPERAKKVNFTDTYYFMGQTMVVNKKVASHLKTMEDFNDPDTIIAVRMGSTGKMGAEKTFPKATLREFEDEGQVVQELLNGNAHAVVSGSPKPENWSLAYPDTLELALDGRKLTKEPNGFALRKGDFDSLVYLNNWITSYRAQGYIQEREHYWFQTNDWKSSD